MYDSLIPILPETKACLYYNEVVCFATLFCTRPRCFTFSRVIR